MIDDAVFRPSTTYRRQEPARVDAVPGHRHEPGLAGLLRRLGLSGADREERVVHEYAAILNRARTPLETRRGLVRLACRLAQFGKAALDLELQRDQGLRRVAIWPESVLVHTDRPEVGSTVSLVSTPEGARMPRAEADNSRLPAFSLPLAWQGGVMGWLQFYDGPSRISAATHRRLETLCMLAALAEFRLRDADATAPMGVVRDPLTGLYQRSFLDAFLQHGLMQARRRNEPLAVLYIAPDRIDAIRRGLGRELADAAFQRVAKAVVETLRLSDIVARVDRDRLAAVLPTATPGDALQIARRLTLMAAEAGLTAATDPPVTASVGVAGYPDHAQEAVPLRRAAAASLVAAQARGCGQVVLFGDRSIASSPVSIARNHR